MSKNKTIAYIVGHRNSKDPSRLKNLLFVLKWLANLKQILIQHKITLKIIVVEQDDSPKLGGLYDPKIVTHIFAYNTNLYNRGWGFNIGFKAVKADYYFFADNDIILKVRDIINVFLKCFRYEAVNPYSKVLDSTKIYIESPTFDPTFSSTNGVDSDEWEKLFLKRKYICFSGGIVGLSKKAVYVVSGWDERFKGRGWEDYAFTAKIKLFLYDIFTFKNSALHLWHELEDPSIKKINCELNKEYQKYNVHDYVKQIENSRNFGFPLKYSIFGKREQSNTIVIENNLGSRRIKHALNLYYCLSKWITKKYHLNGSKRKLYIYLYLCDQLKNTKHGDDKCKNCDDQCESGCRESGCRENGCCESEENKSHHSHQSKTSNKRSHRIE